MCTRKKDVEKLSCGFEDILFILFDVTKIDYKHTLVKQIISIFA